MMSKTKHFLTRTVSEILAIILVITMQIALTVPAFAIDIGGTPFVPDARTAFALEFINKCDNQQWFMDAVERILNTSSLSINTIKSAADLSSVVALTAIDKDPKTLPAAIEYLNELRYLFLGSSGLTGTIPDELWSCTKLENIDMSGNALTGELPASIAGLSALKVLQLHNNSLTGAIPTAYPALETLDLANNIFTAGIPTELGSVTTLRSLALSGNKLGGGIPTTLQSLTNLKVLMLYDCALTGEFPSWLGNLTSLQMLDLSVNKLVGDVPSSLVTLQSRGAKIAVTDNYIYGANAANIAGNTANFISGSVAGNYQLRLSLDAYTGVNKNTLLNVYTAFKTVRADNGSVVNREKLLPANYEVVLTSTLSNPSDYFEITSDTSGIYVKLLKDIPFDDAIEFELRMLPYDAASPYSYTSFTLGTEIKSGGGNTGSGGGNGGGGSSETEITDSQTPTGALESNHVAYITGIDATHVAPDAPMTREEAATVLWRIMGEKGASYDGAFPDVEVGRWSATAIAYMKQSGIMDGYPDGTFNPTGSITRAEFATVLVRLKAYALPATNNFIDALTHWAAGYIGSASENGLMNGYPDGTFKPDANITRAEVITAVNRMLGRAPDSAAIAGIHNPYVDLQKTHWAYEQIMEAVVTHNAELDAGIEVWVIGGNS